MNFFFSVSRRGHDIVLGEARTFELALDTPSPKMPLVVSQPLLVIALLLGLLLLVLLASVPRQGLLKNLEDLLVRNLLVSLVLANIKGRGRGKLGQTVLGDG